MNYDAAIVITIVGLYLVYFIYKGVEKVTNDHKTKEEVAVNEQEWMRDIEPKYRGHPTYPHDWSERKVYVQKRDNYACQYCGRTVYDKRQLDKARKYKQHPGGVELHVHHIKPLSKGGDNSLNNLISLCETCHENQHPHMLSKKLSFYKKKRSRARSGHMKIHWDYQIQEILERLKGKDVL